MLQMIAAVLQVLALPSSNVTRLDINVDPRRVVAKTSDRFVSFTLDFHLCEIEQPGRGEDCNWHNSSALLVDLPRLLPFARALSPYGTALLRIGGGAADSVVYNAGGGATPVLKRSFVGPLTHEGVGNFTTSCPDGPYCLTMERWDELNEWALQAGVKIVLGLNALSANMTLGYGGKSAVISGVPWDSTNVRALLEHTKRRGWFEQGTLFGFELGNEIQGPESDGPPGSVHRGLAAPFHARQFVTLSAMIAEIWGKSSRPKLIGPDQNPGHSAWSGSFLRALAAANVSLDAFTYHAYDGGRADHAPGVLARELPTPAFLDRHVARGESFRALVAAEAPRGCELWLGEFADCAGSGVTGVSDAFEGALAYVDALGSLARLDHTVLMRQALIGGDYELVDRRLWAPNPAYWMGFLWPRLMSTRVLDLRVTAYAATANASALVRAYAHCGLLLGGATLALVSISPTETLSVDIRGLQALPSDQPRQEYHFSGSASGDGGLSPDNLASRVLYMRGEPVTEDSFVNPLLVPVSQPTLLAPLTVAFIDIPDASVGVCLSADV